MKICKVCAYQFDSMEWKCPSCGSRPNQIEGFFAFAPELALENDGFPPESFNQLAELESRNFWFRARNQLIIWAIQRYFPQVRDFLEIGCGTGFVLSGIEKAFPDMRLTGCEVYANGLKNASSRLKRTNLIQMDARAMPFEKEFDLVGCFDTLEHIEEDEAVLAQINKVLRPGGGVILTVPQHPALWSYVDEYSCHVRRYTRKELIQKMNAAGFTVKRCTSFVSLLLPLMLMSRVGNAPKKENFDPTAELRINATINTALEKILDFERLLIRAGVNFPAGGSLLMLAIKNR